MTDRRQRIHELVLALLARQNAADLLDADAAAGEGRIGPDGDAGGWLERNRRVVNRYQALVRSAITLDALIDQEVSGRTLGRSSVDGGRHDAAPSPPEARRSRADP